MNGARQWPGSPKVGAGETVTVRLANYVLLSPEAINLDEANRAKLQAVDVFGFEAEAVAEVAV